MKQFVAAVLLAVLALPATAQSGEHLAEATMQYLTTVNVMGQELAIPSTRTLSKVTRGDRALWRVVDVAEMPAMAGGGTAVDTFEVDAMTLMPVRRSGSSMGGTVRFTYDGAHVKGDLSSTMGEMTVDSTFAEPIAGDGAAFELMMAGLDLAPGFERSFLTYSPQMQGTRAVQIAVAGEESVTVPAGTFETYVVEFAPQDGNPAGKAKIFVTKAAPHITVRAESDLGPQMGGAVAVTELQKK